MKNRLLQVIFVFSVIAFNAFLFASCGCTHSSKTPIVTVLDFPRFYGQLIKPLSFFDMLLV